MQRRPYTPALLLVMCLGSLGACASSTTVSTTQLHPAPNTRATINDSIVGPIGTVCWDADGKPLAAVPVARPGLVVP